MAQCKYSDYVQLLCGLALPAPHVFGGVVVVVGFGEDRAP